MTAPSPWSRLRDLLVLEASDLVVVAIYAVGIGLLSLATPIAVQSLLGFVAFGGLLQPIIVLASVLAAVLFFVAGLKAMQSLAVEYIGRRIFLRAGAKVAQRVVQPDERHNLVKLTNRFFDVVTLEKSASVLLFDGIAVVLQILAGMALLAVYHPLLLAFDLLVAMGVALIILMPGRGAVRTALEESTAKFDLADWLEELALNPGLFSNDAGERFAQPRTHARLATWLDARRRHFRRVFIQITAFLLLQALALTALLALGGWLVVERELAVGQLVAAELVMASTVAAIARLGKLLQKAYDLLAALQKLGYATDGVDDDSGKTQLAPSERGLALTVSNAAGELHVEAGSRLRLEGGEGAGKTHLLQAVARLDDEHLHIALDGVDARLLDSRRTRADVHHLGHAGLLEGTVEDNLCVARPDASGVELTEVLEAIGLTEAVRRLPDGLKTHLTAEGAPLSGAQSKRLLAARALLAKPRLLLMDRFLADLPDASLNQLVNQLIEQAPWTVVCVTDDPRVIPFLDSSGRPPPRHKPASEEVA